MRNLILFIAVLGLASCSFFEKSKKPVIEKASVTAQKASKKLLGCETGDAVYSDVEKELSKLLKVKSQKNSLVVLGAVCRLAVAPIVKSILGAGNKELPDSWKADKCSLDGFEGDANKLITKLCEKL